MNIEYPPKWKIACFDLDGTLVRGTSTGQHLAEKIGHAKEMKQIETLNRYGKASNADVAALDSKYYSGYKKADIHLYLEDIPPGAFRRLFVLLPGVSLQNISPNVMALLVGVVQIYVLIRKAYLREKYFLTLLKRTNLVLLKLSVKKKMQKCLMSFTSETRVPTYLYSTQSDFPSHLMGMSRLSLLHQFR